MEIDIVPQRTSIPCCIGILMIYEAKCFILLHENGSGHLLASLLFGGPSSLCVSLSNPFCLFCFLFSSSYCVSSAYFLSLLAFSHFSLSANDSTASCPYTTFFPGSAIACSSTKAFRMTFFTHRKLLRRV